MKYSNKWLLEKYQQEEQIKFLFFWGHRPTRDGSISASCFSQWWPADFVVNDITYKTAEHWMMAGKARLFNDEVVFGKIIKCTEPGEAKKLGREISNFDPATWDEHKFNIVVEGNVFKFSQHQPLQDFLLNTQNRVLVEASPVDSIWGNGMAADHPDISNPLKWKGQNLLGYALMEVRDKLMKNGRTI